MGFETCVSEHSCTMIQRFTCGVDVIDNDHSLELSLYPVDFLPQRESVTNVGRAPGAVEPALARPVADAAEQRSIGDPGAARPTMSSARERRARNLQAVISALAGPS